MKKISSTQDFKIRETKELDYTKLSLEKKAIRQMVKEYGAIWFILYEFFILDDSISIQEFKSMFLLVLFVYLPLFLVLFYSLLIIITFLGGVNHG